MPDGSQISEKDLADLLAIRGDVSKVTDTVKNLGEDILKKVDHGATVSAELTEKVDKALSEQGTLRARMDEMDQKLVRRAAGLDQPGRNMTPGEIFIADERVKAFCSARDRGRVRVDMAAITTGNVGGTRDTLVPIDRQPGIVVPPERRMTIRDLLTPGRTSSNSIQFVRETGFTNNAAPQSEGATKGESTIVFELDSENVATIAHFMVASKQILDDAPALQSHIDGRLRYGLAYEEEVQLLSGDGTGPNLHGIIPQATAYAAPFVPQLPSIIDTVRLAILQSELALFPATGCVFNLTDWAKIELTKDTTGRYIFANVQGSVTPMLWSRSVVATPAMTIDKFLVGAFRLGAQLFDREDANVEISTEDSDNFRKNLITIRAEERLVLLVYRPEAFVYGDFGNVT
jgi:HK97 family phage major capsid protein